MSVAWRTEGREDPRVRHNSRIGAPDNSDIELTVSRGSGLHLTLNGHSIERAYGVMLMAELAVLGPFPAVRIDVEYRGHRRPAPASMARMIAAELGRNEIWD